MFLLMPQVNLQHAFSLKMRPLDFADCLEICDFQFNLESIWILSRIPDVVSSIFLPFKLMLILL